MSALMGPQEAAQLAERRRVQSYFSSIKAPPPKPPRPRPISPFNPIRLEEERQRLASMWQEPPPAPYDAGPGYGLGPMTGSHRRKHISLTIANQCENIAVEVAAKHRLSLLDISSGRRDRPTSAARQEVFWRCRHETGVTIPALGKLFNRDHTTVLWGISQHQRKIDEGAK